MDHFFRKSLITVITNFLLLCFISQAQAQNKVVVVVPLLGDTESASDINNVVTVALEGGDFTSPVAAMNSINDAATDNRYLLAIAPGIYSLTETLVAKPYVSIVGSGQISTIIRAGNNVGTTLETASTDRTTISNLTIQNFAGNGGSCLGIFDDSGDGARLTHITVQVSGCTFSNVAISSAFGASIDNVTVLARGGTHALAISLFESPAASLENLNISVGGASLLNQGISAYYGDSGSGDNGITILDSSISVNSSNVNAEVIGVNIIHDGPGVEVISRLVNSIVNSSGVGVSISGDNKTNIGTSYITGEEASLGADADSTFVVSSSSLIGGVSGAGNKKCANSDNGEGEELTSACLEN